MIILAPTVVGPINNIAPQVQVNGVFPGAKVTLLICDDSNFLNAHEISSMNATSAVATFSIAPGILISGKYLTANQLFSSIPSGLAPAEIIGLAPASSEKIPTIACQIPPHRWIDWMPLNGLIPGFEIVAEQSGIAVGKLVASKPFESMPIYRDSNLSIGQPIEVYQQCQLSDGSIIKGSANKSMPVINFYKDTALDSPDLISPEDCSKGILVNAIENGATLFLGQDEANDSYAYIGKSVYAITSKELHAGSKVFAKQTFVNAGPHMTSPLTSVSVIPGDLKEPGISGPLCENPETITVYNLTIESAVYIQLGLRSGNGEETWFEEQTSIGCSYSTTCDFNLPTGWYYQSPQEGVKLIKVWQEKCGKKSKQSIAELVKLPVNAGPKSLAGVYECSHIVKVLNCDVSKSYRIWSGSGYPLSHPLIATTNNLTFHLYRALIKGEEIFVTQSGCHSDNIKILTKVVDGLSSIPMPVLTIPIRLPHKGIEVDKLLIGGVLFVYINGIFRFSVSVDNEKMFIPIGFLKLQDTVQVISTFCQHISGLTPNGHNKVVLGEMKLKLTQSPYYYNEASSIVVEAFDIDNGIPVNAQVFIGNVVIGKTFVPFTYLFQTGVPIPQFVVKLNEYQDASISPNVQIRPTSVRRIGLNLSCPSYVKIEGVTWTIHKRNLSVIQLYSTKNGANVHFDIPLSEGNNFVLECLASISYLDNPDVGYLIKMSSSTNFDGNSEWHILTLPNNSINYNFQILVEDTPGYGRTSRVVPM